MMKMHKKLTLALTLFALSPFFSSRVFAQKSRAPAFLRELTSVLLAGDSPLELGDELGWRGVVLTEISIPNIQEISRRPRATRQQQLDILQAMQSFDRPLSVTKGYGIQADTVISEIWQDLLKHMVVSSVRPNGTEHGLLRVLRPGALDSIDRARKSGDKPSPITEKFYAYRRRMDLLSQCEDLGSTAWRLEPGLARYGDLAEAKRETLEDWKRFGWYEEVSSAKEITVLKKDAVLFSADVFERYNLTPANRRPTLKTWLSPPADAWDEMPYWLGMRSATFGGRGTVEYQLARVRIVRPWFHIDDLLDGRLRLDPEAFDAYGNYFLSDGAKPTLLDYPLKGKLSVYPEEVILVRNIKYDALGPDPEHPLNFPDPSVNLLGYVVRTLPAFNGSR
jgi:hypothetical protein